MNAGFMFQDKHWPPTEEPRKTRDVINTRSYVIHRNDNATSDKLLKHFQSIQTVLSYTDILELKKLSNEGKFRRTRSQDSLTKSIQQSLDDVIDWLHDIYYEFKPNLWTEKLNKLANKLSQPGGEEKLKKKIDRCIKKMPTTLTDRNKNLSEQILGKIKRLCSRNDKLRTSTETKRCKVNGSFVDRGRLRKHIDKWLKTLPIKRKDNFGRIIRKDVISDSILYKLETLIHNKPNSLLELQNLLRPRIMQIVYDIPMEHAFNKNEEYVKTVTDQIVTELIDINDGKASMGEVKYKPKLDERTVPKVEEAKAIAIDKRQPTEKDIKDFVTDEMTYFLEGTNLSLSESSMIWIERELTDILMEALMNGFESDDNLQEDINMVLQDFGNFTEFQAEVFIRKLRNHFRNTFLIMKETYSELLPFLKYPKHCLVYYNINDNNISEKYFCANTKTYFEQLSKKIEEWLLKSNLNDQFKNEMSRHFAVTHLVETIIKRHKYLERHPSRKREEGDETEFLKFQVRKWVRKFIDDKEDLLKKVPELTTMLKEVPVPLLTTVQEIIKLSSCRNAKLLERNYVPNSKYAKKVYEEIYDWYQDLPVDLCYVDDKKSRKLFIRMLADNIERSIKENTHKEVRELIAKEVDYWVKRVLKCSPNLFLVEELKYRINRIPLEIERDLNEMPVKKKSIATYTTANNTDIGLEGIERKVNSDYNIYFNKVTREIDKWLTEILPETKRNVSRKFAVCDLAADIVERKKYLTINSSSCVSEYEELETLKYQIFKWLNKTIGDKKLETVKYAAALNDRIQAIPIPKQTIQLFNNTAETYCKNKTLDANAHKSTEQSYVQNKSFINLYSLENNDNTHHNIANEDISKVDYSIQCDSLHTSNNNTNYIIPFICGSSETECQEPSSGSSNNEVKEIKINSVKFSNTEENKNIEDSKNDVRRNLLNNTYPGIYKINTDTMYNRFKNVLSGFLGVEEEYSVPHGLSLTKTYEYFENIFKNRCAELPLEATTPEQKQLVDIARQGMYNGIWKMYFKLKSDPNVENDYTLFEAILEDKLDAMLDVLPQTSEMQTFRMQWKAQVLADVLKMLEYIHSITEAPSFRTILANNFSRSFSKAKNKELNDKLKHLFLTETVDAFILHSRYKNDDELKANIYKQRLMKKLENLCENIKIEYPAEFGNVNLHQLCQETFKILGNIALPEDETLRDEAEEIILGDEVDQWCRELPVNKSKTVIDVIVRNKTKELFIKKLYELEKRLEFGDNSANNEMRREIGIFLENNADLNPNDITNLNLLIDVLINRLKSRKQAGYNFFQEGRRKSSILVQPDPGTIMAPLIDSKSQSKNISIHQSIRKSQAAGSIGYTDQASGPIGFTDQAAGPSRCTDQLVPQILVVNPHQQYMNLPKNQYLAVPEQYPQNAQSAGAVFGAVTGNHIHSTASSQRSVNARVKATNTNSREFHDFEDLPCPCLEFYRKKNMCFCYGQGGHSMYMPMNYGYSMF